MSVRSRMAVGNNGRMARTAPTRSAWWSRSRGLPAATHASWVASTTDLQGRSARILAWARMPDGYCIGSLALLSYGGEHGWQHLGWHQIQRGGWNAERGELSWTEVAEPDEIARRQTIPLSEPGRLPELFRERVAATIAVERFVPIAGERGVIVTARRDLGRDGSISWHSSLTRGLTWQTEGVLDTAVRAVEERRTEYDFH